MAENLKTEEAPIEGEKYPVRIVCSWCGKDLGDAGFTNGEKGTISHGICKDCAKKFEEESEEELEEVKN